ncbi:T9SS type A sorting domain-containing protein [Flavobacterium myungsuense]|uniref:T9SS type A sorting domain-containing protein n=1 Tax=Flavobacterium myungsuense TaxID=651823 RepID=A0ABW3J5X1_9FLAO
MKKITLLLLFVVAITAHGQNKLLSSIDEYYSVTTWEKSSGSNYEYDNNNNLVGEYRMNWNNSNSTWENSGKTTFTYNAGNKVTQELNQNWNILTSTLENSYKQTYTYTNGKITEIVSQEWLNSSWVNTYKTVITYNSSNLPETAIGFTWEGLQWVTDKSRTTLTYNSNNRVISDLQEIWDGTQWVNDTKTLYTYNANNKIINQKSAKWDDFNSLWVPNGNKSEYEWDTSGNKAKETEYYTYSDANNNQFNNQFKKEYTFDTSSLMSSFANPFKDKTGFDYLFEDFPFVNKVLVENEFNYDANTSTYSNNSRTTYNYNSSITLSTKQPEITIEKIKVYPNPTKDFLNIQNIANNKIDKVIISDIIGKTVLKCYENAKQINVQDLSKGIYLIEAFSGKVKFTSKFVKE